LNTILKPLKNNTMIFILIASMPDRSMRNMVNKALVHINKDTYINHQIKNLLKINKKAKVLVVCSFESKKIYDNMIKHPRVTYIQHKYHDYSNVGESLKTIIDYIPNDSVIHVLDLCMVIDPNVFKQIVFKESSIIVDQSKKFKSKIGCVTHNNTAEFVFYDLPQKICEHFYINKKDIILFKHILKTYIKNNMYLFEIINTMISHNIKIHTIKINNNIIHFNQTEQLQNIKNLFRKLKNASAV